MNDESSARSAMAAAASEPGCVELQIRAALANIAIGDNVAALGFYDEAWTLGVPFDERRDVALGYASMLLEVGRGHEAVVVVREALAAFPHDAALRSCLALALHELCRFREAMSVALSAVLEAATDASSLAGYEDQLRSRRDQLGRRDVAEFGLAPYDRTRPEHDRAVGEAKNAAADRLFANEVVVEAEILVGDDLVFLPRSFIGSVGSLFVPSSGRYIGLGSHTGLADFLWAYRKGVALDDSGGERLSNVFTITAVHRREATLEWMRRIFNGRFVKAHIEPSLSSLPMVIDDVEVYFGISQLRRAEQAGDFEFEIE